MVAAGRAAELGKKVLLLEKNKKLGAKLSITGGGRCNITNAEFDTRTFLKKYGKAEPFLYSLFAEFGVKDTFAFFEKLELPLVVEALNRAFPKTQKAADVLKALEKYMHKSGVEVLTAMPVTRVEASADAEGKKISAVYAGNKAWQAKSFVFATGSVSHKETGSTGDGFQWLKTLGHTVHEPTPTIVPLKVTEAWIKRLSGTALSGVKITFFEDGKKAFALKGKILCTHFGISGPLILNNAYQVAYLLQGGAVTAQLDLFPALDSAALEKKIIGVFDANKNKTLKNVLKEFLPVGTHSGLALALAGTADLSKQVNAVSKEERKRLVRMLKALPLTIEGLMGFDRAVVADGGIPLEEVDTKTMRSRRVANLFVTGDLLHINRPSGGYSLQLCWSTGYVAGTSAAQK